MIIISNNCLGGFVYRDILKTTYTSPFIWTLFKNLDEYIYMIENWDNINFDNIEITKEGEGLKNNFVLVIDNKIHIHFIHVIFNEKYNSPEIINENVYVNKPWEYIIEKYKSRLKRMKTEKDKVFLYFEPTIKDTQTRFYELPDICETNKFKCLIFTDKKDIIPNKYTTIVNVSDKIKSAKDISKLYKKEIMNFISN